ncbi:hypothetical protein, partial [Escherichia coli]|uniref:hypothetical protein n=1 Tax=Escherichia coli TaxID=562 RepID=UPI0013D19761
PSLYSQPGSRGCPLLKNGIFYDVHILQVLIQGQIIGIVVGTCPIYELIYLLGQSQEFPSQPQQFGVGTSRAR